jgi:hypothetical protein
VDPVLTPPCPKELRSIDEDAEVNAERSYKVVKIVEEDVGMFRELGCKTRQSSSAPRVDRRDRSIATLTPVRAGDGTRESAHRQPPGRPQSTPGQFPGTVIFASATAQIAGSVL